MKPEALLSVRGLRHRWADGTEVLAGVDLALMAGECHVLLGRSGCGKSTLLQVVAGLLRPSAGQLGWRGAPLRGPEREIALVFQRPSLLDWLTVEDNVLLPVSLQGRVPPHEREQARHWLARLGLSGMGQRRPAQLSGGQQSRVAIARAWMQRPRLLCMDEPFAALDALTREDLQHELMTLCAEQGTAVLFVTHDLAEAAVLGDRVSLLHQGRLTHALHIDQAQPRARSWRDDPAYHATCAQLRRHLEASR